MEDAELPAVNKNHSKPLHPLPLNHTRTSYILFDILTTMTVCDSSVVEGRLAVYKTCCRRHQVKKGSVN